MSSGRLTFVFSTDRERGPLSSGRRRLCAALLRLAQAEQEMGARLGRFSEAQPHPAAGELRMAGAHALFKAHRLLLRLACATPLRLVSEPGREEPRPLLDEVEHAHRLAALYARELVAAEALGAEDFARILDINRDETQNTVLRLLATASSAHTS